MEEPPRLGAEGGRRRLVVLKAELRRVCGVRVRVGVGGWGKG